LSGSVGEADDHQSEDQDEAGSKVENGTVHTHRRAALGVDGTHGKCLFRAGKTVMQNAKDKGKPPVVSGQRTTGLS
jgi:hypothetical protein